MDTALCSSLLQGVRTEAQYLSVDQERVRSLDLWCSLPYVLVIGADRLRSLRIDSAEVIRVYPDHLLMAVGLRV